MERMSLNEYKNVMSTVLGVIPARGGSKGLPGKNLRFLSGKPLIDHTIRAAQQCSLLTDFLVSTDDPVIAEVARKAGSPVPFLRPAELSQDDSPTWPVVRHAVAHWEMSHHRQIDCVVLLQPTSPLRESEDIVACLAALDNAEADVCVSVVREKDSPCRHMVKFHRGSSRFIQWCFPSIARLHRRQDCPDFYRENGAVYAVRRQALISMDSLADLRRVTLVEMPRARSLDIDDEDDLALAEFWMSRLSSQP